MDNHDTISYQHGSVYMYKTYIWDLNSVAAKMAAILQTILKVQNQFVFTVSTDDMS